MLSHSTATGQLSYVLSRPLARAPLLKDLTAVTDTLLSRIPSSCFVGPTLVVSFQKQRRRNGRAKAWQLEWPV